MLFPGSLQKAPRKRPPPGRDSLTGDAQNMQRQPAPAGLAG